MKRRPFTLIEILTVMVIIAILMGMIVGGAGLASRKGAESKTTARLKAMTMALEQYRSEWGFYPAQLADYEVKWDESGFANKRNTPFLGEDDGYPTDANSAHDNYYKDAWGHPFYYKYPGTMNPESYDLWSTGHDEKQGEAGVDDDGDGNTDTDTNGQDVSDALTGKSRNSDDIANWKRD